MAWLEDWSNRYKITIDGSKIDSDIVDFPLPIVLSSGTGIIPFDASGIFNELSAVSGTIFTENFSSGMTDWYIVTGSGNADSGYLAATVSSPATNISSSGTVFLDENFDISVSMRWGASGWAWFGGIVFGYNDSTGNYSIGLHFTNTPAGNYFYVSKRVSTTTTTFCGLAPAGYGAGSWFTLRVRRNGPDCYFKAWRFDYTEPTAWQQVVKNVFAGTEEKSGKIRLANGSNNSFWVDNIIINKHASVTLQKMAMTYSDGATQLPVEIECWDQYAKTAIFWAKLPAVSLGTDTVIYLYYDKTKPNNTTYIGYTGDAIAEGVWDSNFKAVYHFNSNADNTALGFKDSTNTHNHGKSVGMNNLVTAGKIGTAWSFSGSYCNVIIDDIGDTLDLVNNYTLEAVVYPTTKDDIDSIICKAGSDVGGYQLRGTAGIYNFMSGVGSTGNYTYNNTMWYYLAATFSGTSVKLYVNGFLYSSATATTSGTPTNASPFYIGRCWSNDYYYFNGDMAEIRASSTARSAAWIKASYYGMWNDLLNFEYEGIPVYTCSGIVSVDTHPTDGIPVCLYRRSTGELAGRSATTSGGHFTIGSMYNEDHYVIALYTASGINAIIKDWIAP